MTRRIPGIAVMIVGTFTVACNFSKDMEAAESEVTRFHGDLASGKYDEIYDEASDDLKKATSREDFVRLLKAVHTKLGPTRESNRTGFNMNLNTSGHFVTLTYDTKFEKGKGTEQFTYRVTAGKTLLAGYHILSNDLITN
ncbi:MAG TPA: DUF4019 domain-containing protein [Thermoanaerobaculia bacterium]